MLTSSVYKLQLCGISIDKAHVIKQWSVFCILLQSVNVIQCLTTESLLLFKGTSNNTSKAAFREAYSLLHELRALAPSVSMVTVTATSTKHTREIIIDILQMENPHVIYESPNKPNITYSVCYMQQDESVSTYFQWLVEEPKQFGIQTTRTIIYCQTIKQCTIVYSTLKGMLGTKLFTAQPNDRRHVLMEMLH
jgi:hypothetical protein